MGKGKAEANINSRLQMVVKSGKFSLGYQSTLKSLRQGKAKLIIIANNCSPVRKSEVEYYAMLAKTSVHHFNGNNIDLGTACGKLFTTSMLSIIDAGVNFDPVQNFVTDEGVIIDFAIKNYSIALFFISRSTLAFNLINKRAALTATERACHEVLRYSNWKVATLRSQIWQHTLEKDKPLIIKRALAETVLNARKKEK